MIDTILRFIIQPENSLVIGIAIGFIHGVWFMKEGKND